MANHILSVCIFCFICATHSPCGSHAAVEHESKHINNENSFKYGTKQLLTIKELITETPSTSYTSSLSRIKLKSEEINLNDDSNIKAKPNKHNLKKRNSIEINKIKNDSFISKEDNYLNKIFDKYGDGKTMTMDNFEKFIKHLDLLQIVSKKLDNKRMSENNNDENINVDCLDRNIFSEITNLTKSDNKINDTLLQKVCPAILYSILVGQCNDETHVHSHIEHEDEDDSLAIWVWIYSTSSVILTSACGVLALVIIPVMQKKFYKPLLQFLVALAVGTLAGDAFLHLLPHAMTKPHSHGVHHTDLSNDNNLDQHDENMWKGFVAMLGLTFFFFMERLILLAGKWRKGRHKKPDEHSHIKFLPNGLDDLNDSNPTQCMDRYNPYPYCYQDILNHQLHGCPLESDKTTSTMLDDIDGASDISFKKIKATTPTEKLEDNQNNISGCLNENNLSNCTENNKMLPGKTQRNDNITIILREHGSSHHGHSHSHGHVHAAPTNFSSVAWMVIMGDGLHNFTDGMAIGAAFSGSLAGGFSTAVAVFCHELPHELGDFAMLLKAGMTIRQALFYNLLSSVLSIFGNVIGICLGNTEYASSWVFAAAAGMFIYIALVDMIPELSSSHEDESNLMQCCLHISGLLSGFGIMTVIALYEQDLKSIFKEPA